MLAVVSTYAALAFGDRGVKVVGHMRAVVRAYQRVVGSSLYVYSKMISSLLALMKSMQVLSPFPLIASRGKSSSSGASCSPVVRKQSNASAAWSFMPARWITSKSDSASRQRHHANHLVPSVKFRIHFNTWWSVQMVNRVRSK